MGFFELAVILLFALALVDLSVGVSNDAVNFLNSAIGSRVTTRRVILIVASFGVLAGALFSSGIMEVARKGIFNPEMFTFADVMVIFLAVMLADVLLLDLFNTFGLPTSTTVSIVFELLGAATAVALIITMGNPEAGGVLEFINHKSAMTIIAGIGLSVVVAFVVGTLVQFFSRMLFTFQKANHGTGIRVGWSAVAFTLIVYFLFIKGLKGASFVTPEALAFVRGHMLAMLGAVLAVSLTLMFALHRAGVDVLATVVLVGTFALAMAFASNDLVNFIGVPLAGLSSWQAWTGSGVAADAYAMTALTEPVRGHTLILLGAGAVMVTTLWLSSKARSVTQTEVNLGRQDEGVERFRPGPVSRGIVRAVVAAGEATVERVPEQWRTGIAERFAREKAHTFDLDRPAFDTLRASVNLAVASVLIAFATSLKLPLSTTFVSFMVAMGTSLADQAWGRDSAVYRLAGVFSVIGGWLVTALAAFTMAGTFAFLIHRFGPAAIVVLVAAAVFALVHTHRYHANRSRMQQLMVVASPDRMDRDALLLQRHFRELVTRNAEIIDRALKLLVSRKRKKTRKLRASVQDGLSATQATESEFVRRLNRLKPQIEPWLMKQLDVLACERDFVQSAGTVVDLVSEHVLNEHTEPSPRVANALQAARAAFAAAFGAIAGDEGTGREGARAEALRTVGQRLDALTERVLEDLYAGERSTRNTTLLLSTVLELRDVQRELRRASEWT